MPIQEGAAAYLRKQYTTIAIVAIVPFFLLGFYDKLGWGTAFGFLIGAVFSARRRLHRDERRRALERAHGGGRARRAAAGVQRRVPRGLGDRSPRRRARPARRRRATTGCSPSWIGNTPESAVDDLIGLAFGGSLISVFARLGGGIYTKAADVGADLVGQDRGGHPRGRPAQPGRDRGQRRRQRRRLRRHGGRPLRDVRGHRRRRDAARRSAFRAAGPLALPARARRHLDPRVGDRHVLRARRQRRRTRSSTRSTKA